MAKRVKGISRRIKDDNRYVGDVAVYDLNKPLKVGQDTTDFLLIANVKSVSGGTILTVWPSDENGVQAATLPILSVKGGNATNALKSLGYELV